MYFTSDNKLCKAGCSNTLDKLYYKSIKVILLTKQKTIRNVFKLKAMIRDLTISNVDIA